MDPDMDERFTTPDKILTAYDHDWIVARKLAVGAVVRNYDDLAVLVREGITHVLDLHGLSDVVVLYKDVGIEYLCSPAPDDGTPREWTHLRDGVRFADHAIREGGRMLVHCYAGRSRSPSMVYAIMRARGAAMEQAEKAIVENRPIARITYKACVEKHLSDLVEMIKRDRNGF